MKHYKNYRIDETLIFSKKHFVIFIIVFISILIFDHILATTTFDMTILYNLMDTTDETFSSAF